MEIKLSNIIRNKNTYPNWSTGFIYPLKFKDLGEDIEIYYIANKNIAKKKYSRIFLKHIDLTPGFCWALGFIKAKWPGKCFQIANAYGPEEEIRKYWSKSLEIKTDKFFIKRYKHELRKSYFGICHIVIGNVLLRRIIDLINESIM